MEKSAGIILFRRDGDGVRFLLIKNAAHGHWDFPKGHIDPGEDEMQAARRETREECGIDVLEIVPDSREVIRYKVGAKPKEVAYFLAETQTENVTLSDEHADWRWATLDEALGLVQFDNARRLLNAAADRLFRQRPGSH